MKYIYGRNNWKLILEARDNRKKIKKFLNNEDVINWSHNLNKDYSIWIANSFKDEILKEFESEGSFKKVQTDGNKWNKNDVLRLMKNGDDVDEEKESKSDRRLYMLISLYYDRLMYRLASKYRYVMDWTTAILRDTGVRENLKGLSLEDAWNKSDEWHKKIANADNGIIINEEGTILITFKDGYYWLDLETNDCPDEASAMGHCGVTNEGTTLFSLRKNKQPHVTVAFDEDTNEITQMKGKGNTKPNNKYHKYIVDLLINPNIEIDGFRYEYHPEDDFQISDLDDELFEKLYKGNKKMFENTNGYTYLTLYKRGLVGKEKVVEKFDDVLIDEESGDLYFTVDGWLDTVDLVFENSINYRTRDWALEVLVGDTDFYDNNIEFDLNSYWDNIDIETMKIIKKEILEKQDSDDTIYNDEGEELVDLVLTEDNLIVSDYVTVYNVFYPGVKPWNMERFKEKKIGGMYLKLSDDEIYNMSDILEENKDSGYMEEIVDGLNRAASDSYQWSLSNKWCTKITDLITNHLAADADEKNKDRFKFFKNGTKIGFKLDIHRVMELMESSEEGETLNSNSIADVYERTSNWDGNEDKKISHINEDFIVGDVDENINDTIQEIFNT